MKRQSIYVDPQMLKEQNADAGDLAVQPVPTPSDTYMQTKQTPQISRMTQPQPSTSGEEIILTKSDVKELAKEAYEEGLKAAKGKEAAQPTDTPEMQEEPKKPAEGTGKKPQEEHKAAPNEGKKDGGKENHKAPPSQSKEDRPEPQEMLETIVDRNNHVLFHAKSIFPIDFFPDTILIDMTKISIVHKTFFATEHVTAIPLQSVADIFLQTTFLSAALTIKYILRTDRPGIIEPVEAKILALSRHDAITAKNIIRGLVLANEENIDLTKIRIEDLRGKLEELGASKTGV